jgi:type I restriction enzyme S subunit
MNEEQELPQGWMTLNLGEVAFVTKLAGFEYTKFVTYTPDGDLPVIKAENVSKQGFRHTNFSFVKSESVSSLTRSIVNAGDLLMSFVGSVGQVARVPEDRQYFLGPNVAMIRLQSAFVDEKYAELYLRSPIATEIVKASSKSTTQASISMGQIRILPLVVAPLPEQRRIVAKLEELFSKLDAGVAAVRRTQALLKRYRQSVLHAAVTGELTRAWREAHPPAPTETGAALLQRIRAERRAQWEAAQVAKRGGQLPLGEGWKAKYAEPEEEETETSNLANLPENWVWSNLGFLKSFSLYGPRFSSDDYAPTGISVLRTTDINDSGKVNLSSTPKINLSASDFEKYKVVKGDLLITRTGSLGTLAVFNDDIDAIPGAYLIQYRLVMKELVDYCFLFLKSPNGIGALLKGGAGVGRPNINAPTIEAIPVPLPPLAEQAEIVAEVERRLTVLDALSQTLADELRRAERLRQSILHQAFTGRLVPQDATDEPAAALLARLRETAHSNKTLKTKEIPFALAKEKKPRGRKPVDTTQIDFSFSND